MERTGYSRGYCTMKKKDYCVGDSLSHIAQCIENIEAYTKDLTEEGFLNNQLTTLKLSR